MLNLEMVKEFEAINNHCDFLERRIKAFERFKTTNLLNDSEYLTLVKERIYFARCLNKFYSSISICY